MKFLQNKWYRFFISLFLALVAAAFIALQFGVENSTFSLIVLIMLFYTLITLLGNWKNKNKPG